MSAFPSTARDPGFAPSPWTPEADLLLAGARRLVAILERARALSLVGLWEDALWDIREAREEIATLLDAARGW